MTAHAATAFTWCGLNHGIKRWYNNTSHHLIHGPNGCHTPFLGLSPALSFLRWSNMVVLMMSWVRVRVDGLPRYRLVWLYYFISLSSPGSQSLYGRLLVRRWCGILVLIIGGSGGGGWPLCNCNKERIASGTLDDGGMQIYESRFAYGIIRRCVRWEMVCWCVCSTLANHLTVLNYMLNSVGMVL